LYDLIIINSLMSWQPRTIPFYSFGRFAEPQRFIALVARRN